MERNKGFVEIKGTLFPYTKTEVNGIPLVFLDYPDLPPRPNKMNAKKIKKFGEELVKLAKERGFTIVYKNES